MRVYICGVRGSTPAPGPEFVRYGGNTSCVALARDGGPPTLVLDAGTGLQRLTQVLDGRPFRGSILLGHLHWDHTHGLPFFRAGDHPDAHVDLHMPAQGDPVAVLARVLSPPHFPIGPLDLRGDWAFHALELARDVHLLLHDAQYTAAELPERATFGHSAAEYAVGLAERAGARRLLLFHHDPPRTDDAVDEIVRSHQRPDVDVQAAAEGMVVDL